MARNYAALFHEYLDEMADLTDAEFGRLARALLVYSSTGEFPALNGNERLFKRRVIAQEDRAQESYNTVIERNRENGKLGGRPKNPSKPSKTQNNPPKPRQTQTNPDKPNETQKTEIEIEIKNEIKAAPPNGGAAPRAREGAAAVSVGYYLDRVNPSASEHSLRELAEFEHDLSGEVCKRAIDIAIDNHKASWAYIRAILTKWHDLGVKCLADIDRLDKRPTPVQTQAPGAKKYTGTDYTTPESIACVRRDMLTQEELDAILQD